MRTLKPPPFFEELELDQAAGELPPVEPEPEPPATREPGPDLRGLLPWERACILRNRRIRAGLAKWQAEHPPEAPTSLPALIVDMTEPPHCNIEAYYYRVLP